jgi:hypothetical protein
MIVPPSFQVHCKRGECPWLDFVVGREFSHLMQCVLLQQIFHRGLVREIQCLNTDTVDSDQKDQHNQALRRKSHLLDGKGFDLQAIFWIYKLSTMSKKIPHYGPKISKLSLHAQDDMPTPLSYQATLEVIVQNLKEG